MSFLSKAFGDTLKTIRKEKRLTQAQFAVAAGVETPTVSRWESGEFLPTNDKFDAILKALDVTKDEFLGKLGVPGSQAQSDEKPPDLAIRTNVAESELLNSLKLIEAAIKNKVTVSQPISTPGNERSTHEPAVRFDGIPVHLIPVVKEIIERSINYGRLGKVSTLEYVKGLLGGDVSEHIKKLERQLAELRAKEKVSGSK